jgi:hypothetical protein
MSEPIISPKRRPRSHTRGRTASLITALLAGVVLSAQEPVLLRDPKTKDLFAAARVAIYGGPGGIARLRSLRFTGRSRIAGTGGELLAAAVEIRVLVPDHYLRIDTGSFGRRQVGYARNQSLDRSQGPTARAIADPRPVSAILQADRSELARLLLGVAMYASEEVPVKLQTRDTQIDMPGLPEALGIDATGETFAARIAFDGATHFPVRLVFWSGDRTVLTTEYSDRRKAGDMKVPFRIVTRAGDQIVDEMTFDEVSFNPGLRQTDFSR